MLPTEEMQREYTQATPTMCGPACAALVYRLVMDQPCSQEEVRKKLQAIRAWNPEPMTGGCKIDDLCAVMKELNFGQRIPKVKKAVNFADFAGCVDENNPAVALLNTGPDHFVAVFRAPEMMTENVVFFQPWPENPQPTGVLYQTTSRAAPAQQYGRIKEVRVAAFFMLFTK